MNSLKTGREIRDGISGLKQKIREKRMKINDRFTIKQIPTTTLQKARKPSEQKRTTSQSYLKRASRF